VTTDPAIDVHPTWSPDGKKIAFLSNRGGNNDVWVIPASGGTAVQLTNDSANDGAPDWSPDGTRIAFQSDRAGNHDLWVIPVSGGSATRITTDPAADVQPDWSPSGNKIAFSRNGDLWIVTLASSTDLEISKTVDDPLPGEGGSVTYTVILTNLGPSVAASVEVSDPLPAGVTFAGGSATAGGYDEQSGIWSLSNVAAGTADTLTIVATVDAGTGSSTIVNVATVASSDPADANPDNDSSSAAIDVQQLVGVEGFVPDRFALEPGRPSPFRESTAFAFDLPAAAGTKMSVFDVSGRRVAILMQAPMEPGRYRAVWNGRDRSGAQVSPGIYFVRLESGPLQATRRVVRLR
jgi:uncharacterized repeat protein (TIGR01451 family)